MPPTQKRLGRKRGSGPEMVMDSVVVWKAHLLSHHCPFLSPAVLSGVGLSIDMRTLFLFGVVHATRLGFQVSLSRQDRGSFPHRALRTTGNQSHQSPSESPSFFKCVFLHTHTMHACAHTYTQHPTVCTWPSEDNSPELALSFHHNGNRGLTH